MVEFARRLFKPGTSIFEAVSGEPRINLDVNSIFQSLGETYLQRRMCLRKPRPPKLKATEHYQQRTS